MWLPCVFKWQIVPNLDSHHEKRIVYTKMFEWRWLKQGMDTWSKTCVVWDEQLMKINQIIFDFTCVALLLIHSDLHTDSIKTT